MERVLFARIGWMKFYSGSQAEDERPIGGGNYNLKGIGAEVKCFRNSMGKLYTSFMIAHNATELNLQRIDPKARDKSLKNVLLIFFATDPRPNSRGQVVVGWYKKAEVLKRFKFPYTPREYNASSNTSDAVLLPTNRRTCFIPRGKNAPGQSNTYYVLDSTGQQRQFKWIADVMKFVNSYQGPNLLFTPEAEAHSSIEDVIERELATSNAQSFQSNPAARKSVENIAMRSAIRYFKGKGYKVQDVSPSQSYDLHCHRDGKDLYVEVKGSQNPISKIILTPNEVTFARKHLRTMALFLLHSVKISQKRNRYSASGGVAKVIHPWSIIKNRLTPIQFICDIR